MIVPSMNKCDVCHHQEHTVLTFTCSSVHKHIVCPSMEEDPYLNEQNWNVQTLIS